MNRRNCLILTLLTLAPLSAITLPAMGHETDQYTLPIGREFADQGDYLTRFMFDTISRGVEKQNSRIKDAVEHKASAKELKNLQSGEAIADTVNHEFPVALFLINSLDDYDPTSAAKLRNPGRIVGYKSDHGLRRYIDIPLSPFNAWNSACIKAFGVYMGNDKVGHFTDMGKHYFDAYRAALAKGKNEQQAHEAMLKLGTDDPVYSESGLLGLATAGDYSNADLVANYMGFCFYQNLSEPVMLKGELRPPMLVHDGEYWKIADHVRPDSDFFSYFVSDHLNEALNPGWYRDDMRDKIKKAIVESRKNVLVRYADPNGNCWSQEKFDSKTKELFTYWGVDYGHAGGDKLMTIAKMCFAPMPDMSDPSARNADGLTSIHCAAAAGDLAALQRLIVEKGGDANVRVVSDVNAPAVDGDTPLHCAARNGKLDAVRFLISRGAKVNATNSRGDTPLHMAAPYAQVAQALIAAHADVDAADYVGRTPLHWAALDTRGTSTLHILLDSGARPAPEDRDGRTPLHDAAKASHAQAIVALISGGADVNQKDRFGFTPLHLAAAHSGAIVSDLLAQAGARVNERDQFGCTPLHVAAMNGQPTTVTALLRRGADPNATDNFGATALAAAEKLRYGSVARVLQPANAPANEAQTVSATIRP
jgi:ankyrin repeat protein